MEVDTPKIVSTSGSPKENSPLPTPDQKQLVSDLVTSLNDGRFMTYNEISTYILNIYRANLWLATASAIDEIRCHSQLSYLVLAFIDNHQRNKIS